MNKVLIICDQFPPAFGPRMGYLCKYLKHSDWQPVVLTEHLPEQTFAFLTGWAEVTEITYYKAKGKWAGRWEWLGVFIGDLFFDYKSRKMKKEALRLCKQHKFRLILCSAYRTFPLPVARQVAQKTGLPLIADLRDIIEQYSGYEFISHSLPNLFGLEYLLAELFKKQSLRKRNKSLREAAWITTVSPWHVEVLKVYNPSVSLIYNGYDPELFYPESIRTEQFLVTYTGRVLSIAMRNPSLLFEAVKQLSEEQLFSPRTFRMQWYVDMASRQILEKEAGKYNVGSYMDFIDYLPAQRIPEVLNRSSLLLLLTNKADSNGPKGIMTTKFFESLAVEKPILCVRGDEGCLEEAIREAKAGLSAHNRIEAIAFIKQYYQQWKLTGTTFSQVDRTVTHRFSRKAQAEQFISIFNQLTNR